jgi:hypothetical protein
MLLTKEQRKAIHRVFLRKYPFINELRAEDQRGLYRRFRRQAISAIGGECVMIPYANMWLGIEKDGYTHS